MLSDCAPRNWTWQGGLSFEPHAGYRWASSSIFNFETKWTAGLPLGKGTRVVSSGWEGKWTPAAGYEWVAPGEILGFCLFCNAAFEAAANALRTPAPGKCDGVVLPVDWGLIQ